MPSEQSPAAQAYEQTKQEELLRPHELNQPELSPEEIDKAERIIAYARSLSDFVWVYRAEGDQDPKLMYSAGGKVLQGSWYTPSWATAQRYFRDRSNQEVPGLKIFALVIPQQMLDRRDDIDKGMSQVNVISPELQNGKKEVKEEQTSHPGALEYVAQIELMKRYARQKNTSLEKLLAE
jgi:hypothetical protein